MLASCLIIAQFNHWGITSSQLAASRSQPACHSCYSFHLLPSCLHVDCLNLNNLYFMQCTTLNINAAETTMLLYQCLL